MTLMCYGILNVRRNVRRSSLVWTFLAGLFFFGCQVERPAEKNTPTHPVRFTDVTPLAGINFRYTFGDFSYDNILESSGSGVAWFDYNNDGWMDLYILNGRYLEDVSDPKGRSFAQAKNSLWQNQGNGAFTDVTTAAGVGGNQWHMAAAIADLDSDGFEDIFLANYGPNIFFHNNGDGTFSDWTAKLNLAGPDTLNGWVKWSVTAAPFDADADGDLDLLVGNFLAFDPYYLNAESPHRMPSPVEYAGQPSLFYQRQPDGSYVESALQAGLHFPQNKVMGFTVFDYDHDGHLDVFQANDHQPNFLLRNRGNGVFDEVGAAAGVAVNLDGLATGSMHGSLGDVDNDGLIDVLVTDLNYGSLYRNRDAGGFQDMTQQSGLRTALDGAEGWGGGLHDFDNDGDVDLFITNGGADQLITKLPTLLVNDGQGRFQNAAPTAGPYFASKRSGRGAAVADYDNDGDLDIAVSHLDFPGDLVLLRNDTANSNHWFGVRLVPTKGATEPAGTVVRIRAGGRNQMRVHQRAQSYLSHNDPRLHFGLGSATQVDTLEIHWPGRPVQRLQNLAADRYITVKEPSE